jgi:biopolymer transport protein ExbD
VKLADELDGDEFALNLTSMTDIVFLMLIFFMLATNFGDPERALGMDLPAASTSDAGPPKELIVNVLEDGTFVFEGQALEASALRARLRQAAASAPETPVTIRGHRLARHEAIVRVMDACGAAGLRHLSVGTSASPEGASGDDEG